MNTTFNFQHAQLAAATPIGGLDPQDLRELGWKPDEPVRKVVGAPAWGANVTRRDFQAQDR